MRKPLAALPLVLLVGCAQSAPCTVKQNADGSATIACPDGSRARVGGAGAAGKAGTNGTSCTVVDNQDGSRAITCPDGTSTTLPSDGVITCRAATTFTLASDVDVIAVRDCDAIDGGLEIASNGVSDLTPLSRLTSVSGALFVVGGQGQGEPLTTLAGLDQLASVGSLLIDETGELADLSALDHLAAVTGVGGGNFLVRDNIALAHITFAALTPAAFDATAPIDISSNAVLPKGEVDALLSRLGQSCDPTSNSTTAARCCGNSGAPPCQ